MRANVFRYAPESGHRAVQSACPFRANSGSASDKQKAPVNAGASSLDIEKSILSDDRLRPIEVIVDTGFDGIQPEA